MPNKVRVVRRRDEVIGQRMRHIMINLAMLVRERRVVSGEEEGREPLDGHDTGLPRDGGTIGRR